VISVITITGIGDHLQPEWLITFTGMRTWTRHLEQAGERTLDADQSALR
jgi:hypothetical protein